MAKKIFQEEQVTDNNLMLLLTGGLGIGLTARYIIDNFIALNPETGVNLLVLTAGLAVLMAANYIYNQRKLSVSVTDKSISYKFFPFHNTKQKIKFEDIASAQIVETSNTANWCGWNINYGRNSYSINGSNGMKISTKDGEEYFIGVSNVSKLKEVLPTVLG